ncbi:hypothetical protein BDV35DRAFT_366306 [Aspergillus flavus]|uniref:Uncharacterized protein n=1 Tax=Aspergillus flavus TaxID=5059 RepID=A0A5N6GLL7_ASPFL|nr:hypothetical protein BDV35DRAFT_366306 [Aspergillus flavus]
MVRTSYAASFFGERADRIRVGDLECPMAIHTSLRTPGCFHDSFLGTAVNIFAYYTAALPLGIWASYPRLRLACTPSASWNECH